MVASHEPWPLLQHEALQDEPVVAPGRGVLPRRPRARAARAIATPELGTSPLTLLEAIDASKEHDCAGGRADGADQPRGGRAGDDDAAMRRAGRQREAPLPLLPPALLQRHCPREALRERRIVGAAHPAPHDCAASNGQNNHACRAKFRAPDFC